MNVDGGSHRWLGPKAAESKPQGCSQRCRSNAKPDSLISGQRTQFSSKATLVLPAELMPISDGVFTSLVVSFHEIASVRGHRRQPLHPILEYRRLFKALLSSFVVSASSCFVLGFALQAQPCHPVTPNVFLRSHAGFSGFEFPHVGEGFKPGSIDHHSSRCCAENRQDTQFQ